MIQNKIRPSTPDKVCAHCPQLFENECRAYSFPHTDEERLDRDARPFALCEARDPLEHPHAIRTFYEVTYRMTPDTSGEVFTAVIRATSGEGAMRSIRRLSIKLFALTVRRSEP